MNRATLARDRKRAKKLKYKNAKASRVVREPTVPDELPDAQGDEDNDGDDDTMMESSAPETTNVAPDSSEPQSTSPVEPNVVNDATETAEQSAVSDETAAPAEAAADVAVLPVSTEGITSTSTSTSVSGTTSSTSSSKSGKKKRKAAPESESASSQSAAVEDHEAYAKSKLVRADGEPLGWTLSDLLNPGHSAYDAKLKGEWENMPKRRCVRTCLFVTTSDTNSFVQLFVRSTRH
jgi:hypothetical protein